MAGKVSTAMAQHFADQYLGGTPTKAIASAAGVSGNTVRKHLIAAGVQLRRPGRPRGRTFDPPREVLLRYNEDFVLSGEIARRHGVSVNLVTRAYTRAQIKRPHPKWVVDRPTREELLELYESGESLYSIAGRLGASTQLVIDLCDSYGIRRREGGWARPDTPGKDGHHVRSSYERIVCNWLTEQGLQHEYEPRLGRFLSDFLVHEYYIEIWGVTNSFTYRERKQRKRAYYRDRDLRLIELTAASFAPGREGGWERALRRGLHDLLPPVS